MVTNTSVAQAGPLSGVRILDMATVVAGPFAATLCGDVGADVVKLELPDGSDPLRGLAPVKDGMSLYWKVTNHGKQGISLDVSRIRNLAMLDKRHCPRLTCLACAKRLDESSRSLQFLHRASRDPRRMKRSTPCPGI